MKAHLTLNIADIDALIRQEAANRGVEILGYTILSHHRKVLEVQGEMLIGYEFTHKIQPSDRELK